MSLFGHADEFEPRDRPPTCCDGLADLTRIDQFVHVLAHSRVPFTAEAVGALSGDGISTAIAALSKALADGDVGVVKPEDYMAKPTGLYIGRLVKRR